MNYVDRAWFAGILEGEGWIGVQSYGGYRYPRFEIQMTDEDVIARIAKLIDRKYTGIKMHGTNTMPSFRVTMVGTSAALVLREIRPLMGLRRTAKINEVLVDVAPQSQPA